MRLRTSSCVKRGQDRHRAVRIDDGAEDRLSPVVSEGPSIPDDGPRSLGETLELRTRTRLRQPRRSRGWCTSLSARIHRHGKGFGRPEHRFGTHPSRHPRRRSFWLCGRVDGRMGHCYPAPPSVRTSLLFAAYRFGQDTREIHPAGRWFTALVSRLEPGLCLRTLLLARAAVHWPARGVRLRRILARRPIRVVALGDSPRDGVGVRGGHDLALPRALLEARKFGPRLSSLRVVSSLSEGTKNRGPVLIPLVAIRRRELSRPLPESRPIASETA